jgi:YHS domain-containing protein
MANHRDPVTGAEVDERSAIRVDHGDHVHYFASERSRDEFMADPKRYHDDHAARHGDSAREQAVPSNWPDENPPVTKDEHGFTAPKFGSAGSGGAEFEPLPPGARD